MRNSRKDAVTFGDMRKCWVCKIVLPLTAYSKKKNTDERHYVCKPCCNARAKAWYAKNRERGLAARLKFSKELRDSALSAIGDSRCRCCGEDRTTMLDIDHINNDGHLHRRSGATRVYRDVIADPSRFQLLCCNCNQSKRRNGGTCEHKTNPIEAMGWCV